MIRRLILISAALFAFSASAQDGLIAICRNFFIETFYRDRREVVTHDQRPLDAAPIRTTPVVATPLITTPITRIESAAIKAVSRATSSRELSREAAAGEIHASRTNIRDTFLMDDLRANLQAAERDLNWQRDELIPQHGDSDFAGIPYQDRRRLFDLIKAEVQAKLNDSNAVITYQDHVLWNLRMTFALDYMKQPGPTVEAYSSLLRHFQDPEGLADLVSNANFLAALHRLRNYERGAGAHGYKYDLLLLAIDPDRYAAEVSEAHRYLAISVFGFHAESADAGPFTNSDFGPFMNQIANRQFEIEIYTGRNFNPAQGVGKRADATWMEASTIAFHDLLHHQLMMLSMMLGGGGSVNTILESAHWLRTLNRITEHIVHFEHMAQSIDTIMSYSNRLYQRGEITQTEWRDAHMALFVIKHEVLFMDAFHSPTTWDHRFHQIFRIPVEELQSRAQNEAIEIADPGFYQFMMQISGETDQTGFSTPAFIARVSRGTRLLYRMGRESGAIR